MIFSAEDIRVARFKNKAAIAMAATAAVIISRGDRVHCAGVMSGVTVRVGIIPGHRGRHS